jgi:hypothetical protein
LALRAFLTALSFEGGLLLPFNSDAAIPIIQSNDSKWDLFRAFFYGQDRFGAWPFLLANLLSRILGFSWTPGSMHVYATLCLVSGVVPMMLLSRDTGPIAGLLYLMVLFWAPDVREALFDFGHVYPWSLPCLLWAWWAIRQSWEQPRISWAWHLVSLLLSFLAVWVCFPCAPILVVLAIGEGLRARAWVLAPGDVRTRRWVAHLLVVLLSIVFEEILRSRYHAFVRANFARLFWTNDGIDVGRLGANLLSVLGVVVRSAWWPWLLLGTGAVLGAALWLRRGRLIALTPPVREGLALGAMLWSAAAVSLPLLFSLKHVRINEFHARYFVFSFLFGALATWLLMASLALLLSPRRAPWMRCALTVLLAAVLVARLPSPGPSSQYPALAGAARALAAKAPGAVLLNGYWGSYVYEALVPLGQLRALPAQGNYSRLPWREALAVSEPVLVGQRPPLEWPGGKPPESLRQYGATLRLVEPDFFGPAPESFALYTVERVDGR